MPHRNQLAITLLVWTAIIALISVVALLVLPYSIKNYGEFWTGLKGFSWWAFRFILAFGVGGAIAYNIGIRTFEWFTSKLSKVGINGKANKWSSLAISFVFGIVGFVANAIAWALILPEYI